MPAHPDDSSTPTRLWHWVGGRLYVLDLPAGTEWQPADDRSYLDWLTAEGLVYPDSIDEGFRVDP